MNDTPRTDKAQWESERDCYGQSCGLCRASHAEQLEREARAWRKAVLTLMPFLPVALDEYEASPEVKAAMAAIDEAETLAWNEDYGTDTPLAQD